MLTDENGILTQAQKAKEETENAQAVEENILDEYENFINSVTGTNTEFTDSLGNKVIVPAGFEVVNPDDDVEDGIIIEDTVYENTKGSQFVWIPVGTIHTNDGDKTINLGRYNFDSTTGKANLDSGEGDYKEETLSEHRYSNTPAKDINSFISRVNSNGGFYIGRYEARTSVSRTDANSELTQITTRPSEYIYTNITQVQAAELSKKMYNNHIFQSDLINSYAWDTTILFIQECSEKNMYSQQTSLNATRENKGTNNSEIQDNPCNIYDMASNYWEWTTETYGWSQMPCVGRGGLCSMSNYFTSKRYAYEMTTVDATVSFRPILYL